MASRAVRFRIETDFPNAIELPDRASRLHRQEPRLALCETWSKSATWNPFQRAIHRVDARAQAIGRAVACADKRVVTPPETTKTVLTSQTAPHIDATQCQE